eukprot:TRINITY_DN31240_c0_g1_i1.p1 TRINITY_DN31240_c0_g1~~TRINITY_DN31240_c0_g1_i1.p1  ORF type:complete len:367 (+),score=78.93 TRINITY_DN31240_c0_g1_i1:62-1162(+)
MAATEERYAFKVEWMDVQAGLLRSYILTFYPRDNSVEMIDVKAGKSFLKRTEYLELGLKDFNIDGIVTVYARQLRIKDYADGFTRKMVETSKARTLALIKPDMYSNIGHVLDMIQKGGLCIAKLQMVKMTPKQANAFCGMQPSPLSAEHASHLASDVCIAMELVGADGVNVWNAMVDDVRSQAAQDEVRNCLHGSADASSAAKELSFFFGDRKAWPTTALFNNCTLGIIRPHAMPQAGSIIQRILEEGFEVSAMRLWNLDTTAAEEFLDVYRDVLPEYPEMVHQLTVGPCLVMELRQEEAVTSFRKLVGPHDPEIAKHLQPNTLRATFGVDRVRNAVHCTDLPEDGLVEVEYFFNVLLNRNSRDMI